jgi:hypothetical protein
MSLPRLANSNPKQPPKLGKKAAWDPYRSQAWLPTVQEVLQADWQDVWHSPHPPVIKVFLSAVPLRVLMCFFMLPPPLFNQLHFTTKRAEWQNPLFFPVSAGNML